MNSTKLSSLLVALFLLGSSALMSACDMEGMETTAQAEAIEAPDEEVQSEVVVLENPDVLVQPATYDYYVKTDCGGNVTVIHDIACVWGEVEYGVFTCWGEGYSSENTSDQNRANARMWLQASAPYGCNIYAELH